MFSTNSITLSLQSNSSFLGTSYGSFIGLFRSNKSTVSLNRAFVQGHVGRFYATGAKSHPFNRHSKGQVGPVQGYLYMHSSRSNTIFTLTALKGSASGGGDHHTTVAWSSGGLVPYVNKSSRKNPYAAREAAAIIVKKARDFGIRRVVLLLKGKGRGRRDAVQTLVRSGLLIAKIIENTPTPHNGCRLRKERRKKRLTRVRQTQFDRGRRH